MGKNRCCIFDYDSPNEAFRNLEVEVVERYGDFCKGHFLHTWDDGERNLLRCKKCGNYILLQRSEFHGMDDDSYYRDYFPVSGPEEAHKWNETCSGFEIEKEFPGKYLAVSNLCPSWSNL